MQWLSGLSFTFGIVYWWAPTFSTFHMSKEVKCMRPGLHFMLRAFQHIFTLFPPPRNSPSLFPFLISRPRIYAFRTNDWNTPSWDRGSKCNLKCVRGGVSLECTEVKLMPKQSTNVVRVCGHSSGNHCFYDIPIPWTDVTPFLGVYPTIVFVCF